MQHCTHQSSMSTIIPYENELFKQTKKKVRIDKS